MGKNWIASKPHIWGINVNIVIPFDNRALLIIASHIRPTTSFMCTFYIVFDGLTTIVWKLINICISSVSDNFLGSQDFATGRREPYKCN